MSTYRFTRDRTGRPIATVDGAYLPARHDLLNHSPDGFEWGYHGSGPAQLALAILAHALKDDRDAVRLHHLFAADTVALMPLEAWELTLDEVLAWAEAHGARPPKPRDLHMRFCGLHRDHQIKLALVLTTAVLRTTGEARADLACAAILLCSMARPEVGREMARSIGLVVGKLLRPHLDVFSEKEIEALGQRCGCTDQDVTHQEAVP